MSEPYIDLSVSWKEPFEAEILHQPDGSSDIEDILNEVVLAIRTVFLAGVVDVDVRISIVRNTADK